MGVCPNCGAANRPEQSKCDACGAPLADAAATIRPPAPTPPAVPATPAAAPAGTAGAAGLAGAAASGSRGTGFRSPEVPPPGPPPPAQVPPTELQQHAPRAQSRSRRGSRSGLRAAFPVLVALGFTLLFEQLVGSLVSPDAYIYRLFRPPGGWLMGVVPALILFAFVWTITDLALKYRVTRRNERDLDRPDIKSLPTMVGGEPPSVTLDRLRGLERDFVIRPVGQRVLWILRHLVTDEDLQRTHELLRHHSDLDADAASQGYRTITLFIWAMPILGFIGTVLGISLAVGGFSDFLTTTVSIDEVDRVTAELGNVASGLSFAFDTTLLGLLAGLLASVLSSGVQKREERFLTGVDELGLQIMANSRPAQAESSAATPVAGDSSAEIRQVLAQMADLSTRMDQFSQSMRSGLAGLNEVSSRMTNDLASSIGSVSQTVQHLGANLSGASDTLTRSVTALGEKLTASEAALRVGLAEIEQTATHSQERDAATQEAVLRLAASIGELGERIADFKKAQDSLTPALTRLAGPLELRLAPAAPPPGDGG